MPTFAFWNTCGTGNLDLIKAFARETNPDCLLLAECSIAGGELVKALNEGGKRLFYPDPVDAGRIRVFTRMLPKKRSLVYDSAQLCIRHLSWPLSESILLVSAHLPSKLHLEGEDQSHLAIRTVREIERAEDRVKHSRTVVIGDLNMNPFESGMISSEGFHAVMDRSIAGEDTRVVNGLARRYFYNPMWSYVGGNHDSPLGTYFYRQSAPITYFWNVFDQVLIRPSLLGRLPEKDAVRVVSQIGGTSLLANDGRPDRKSASDHLPIVLRLKDLERGTANV